MCDHSLLYLPKFKSYPSIPIPPNFLTVLILPNFNLQPHNGRSLESNDFKMEGVANFATIHLIINNSFKSLPFPNQLKN